LTDEDAWEPFEVEGTYQPRCNLYHAVPSKRGSAELSWTSCGEGCSSLDLSWMGVLPISISISSFEEKGGVTTLFAGRWRKDPRAVRRWIDLGTGMVTNALQCISPEPDKFPLFGGGWVQEARFHGHTVFRKDTNEKLVYDLWMRTDGSIGYGLMYPNTQAPLRYFFNEVNQGTQFIGLGSVTKVDFASSTKEVIEPSSAVIAADAQGDLAVWIDALNGLRLRGWAPDGLGVRTILGEIPKEPDEEIQEIALSPQYVVGSFAHNKTFAQGGTLEGLRFWYLPRAYQQVPSSKVVVSPPLPPGLIGAGVYGVATIKTWGDYATVLLHDKLEDQTTFLVVHLPSWTVHALLIPKGYRLETERSVTQDDKALLYARRDKVEGYYDANVVMRYELSHLEKYASSVVHLTP
jgi:hypothetical protein